MATWHRRLLMLRSDTAGMWIAATPTHGISQVNLLDHRVIPLDRNSAFPDDAEGILFAFDGLSTEEWEFLSRRTLALASVLGYTNLNSDGAPPGHWNISDMASEQFGCLVPVEALGNVNHSVTRDSFGLVKLDDRWVPMEKVETGWLTSWKASKRVGPGRDRRIACEISMSGTRFCSEAVAMTHWFGEVKEADKSEKTLVAKYMLGPPAVREFFKQLIQSGMTLAQYDVHWRHKSGVPEGGIASRMHSTLTESLR